jgi:hypothetical protein
MAGDPPSTPSVPAGRTPGRIVPGSSAALIPPPLIPGAIRSAAGTADTDAGSTGTVTIEVYVGASPPDATSICNGAIDLVGAGLDDYDRIYDFDLDQTRLADHCRRRYHPCRRRALLKWLWPEATVYLPGTAASEDVSHPTCDFEYAYVIPLGAGCLALRGIVDAWARPIRYKRIGSAILTNFLPGEFWWLLLLDLATGFSEGLARCIEYELAIDLCGPLLKGADAAGRRRQLHQEYRELALPDAARQAQEEHYDRLNAEAPALLNEIW